MRFPLSSLTPPQRARLAIAALLLVSCGNLYLVEDVVQLWRPEDASGREPDAYIEKLAALQALLPPDAHVGYVNPTLRSDSASKRDLFLVRYALVPRCVAQGSELALVLVGGDAPGAVGSGAPTQLRADLGNGFRLYQRLAPPP
jgi:hypothetical protein